MSALAKYLGRYEDFKRLIRAYGITWKGKSVDDLVIERFARIKDPGSDHITIKLPKELVEEMDRLIGVKGFRSRGEIAKEAIRQLLNQYMESLTPPPLPLLEHFNISENGVRILDRTLANGYSRGRIVDVYFKPDRITCEYCGTDNCPATYN